MKMRLIKHLHLFNFILIFILSISVHAQNKRKTELSVRNNQFFVNGELTYKGRYWKGSKIEGLLFNSRMVQGIFDDSNPVTGSLFVYPDTKKWDPERNTKEFIQAMDQWYGNGLMAFTLNLQGGSPVGYGSMDCINSAFNENGRLIPAYLDRLEKILNKADDLGMVVILGYFYFGQDQHIKNEKAVIRATDGITHWILERGFRNVLVEINNECNIRYNHHILQPDRVHELIYRVKKTVKNGHRLLVSTSYSGGTVPKSKVIKASDFILLHGNGLSDPSQITALVDSTRKVEGYTSKPILFNEDDHFNFDAPHNNFVAAIQSYASWGYFDYRMKNEPLKEGYQSVPVDWGINSERKKSFFRLLKEITGR